MKVSMPSRRTACRVTAVVLTLLAGGMFSCTGGPVVEVGEEETWTVLADGTVTEDEVVGVKRVRARVRSMSHEIGEGGVEVSYRLVDSVEKTGVASRESEDVYFFDLPGSAELKLCEWMYYRWMVTSKDTDASAKGAWIGHEEIVMPEERVVGGILQDYHCGGPATP